MRDIEGRKGRTWEDRRGEGRDRKKTAERKWTTGKLALASILPERSI